MTTHIRSLQGMLAFVCALIMCGIPWPPTADALEMVVDMKIPKTFEQLDNRLDDMSDEFDDFNRFVKKIMSTQSKEMQAGIKSAMFSRMEPFEDKTIHAEATTIDAAILTTSNEPAIAPDVSLESKSSTESSTVLVSQSKTTLKQRFLHQVSVVKSAVVRTGQRIREAVIRYVNSAKRFGRRVVKTTKNVLGAAKFSVRFFFAMFTSKGRDRMFQEILEKMFKNQLDVPVYGSVLDQLSKTKPTDIPDFMDIFKNIGQKEFKLEDLDELMKMNVMDDFDKIMKMNRRLREVDDAESDPEKHSHTMTTTMGDDEMTVLETETLPLEEITVNNVSAINNEKANEPLPLEEITVNNVSAINNEIAAPQNMTKLQKFKKALQKIGARIVEIGKQALTVLFSLIKDQAKVVAFVGMLHSVASGKNFISRLAAQILKYSLGGGTLVVGSFLIREASEGVNVIREMNQKKKQKKIGEEGEEQEGQEQEGEEDDRSATTTDVDTKTPIQQAFEKAHDRMKEPSFAARDFHGPAFLPSFPSSTFGHENSLRPLRFPTHASTEKDPKHSLYPEDVSALPSFMMNDLPPAQHHPRTYEAHYITEGSKRQVESNMNESPVFPIHDPAAHEFSSLRGTREQSHQTFTIKVQDHRENIAHKSIDIHIQ